ncbi:MAG: D-alanine--D-alanine ligase [Gemmatimonadetes bacterium]|nr:D-alanine--D-alanine ligase [Gemmatimonadota bacterium]
MGLNVAVLANLKRNAPALPGLPPDTWAELDTEATTDAIVAALRAAGHRATFLEGDLSLVEKLPVLKPDICFNICEGHWGESRESHVPAILEMLRIPYTGAGVLGLGITLDKPLTKRLLAYHGLPTPAFQVFRRADEPLDPALGFPLFVKPSREGSSLGISASSVVHDAAGLRAQLAAQLERFRQPILVERFIRGREGTVGIIGNALADSDPSTPVPAGLELLPPLEVDLASYPHGEGGVYTQRIKSNPGDVYYFACPAPLPAELTARIRTIAAAVFQVTGCCDVARADFRLDADDGDRPYVLEVNALPGLCPGFSDLVLSAEAAGMSYGQLINGIFDAACRRYGLAAGEPAPTD